MSDQSEADKFPNFQIGSSGCFFFKIEGIELTLKLFSLR
jgi:hypothetical protein